MWNNSLRELWNLMLRIKWNEINPLTPAGISHCEAIFHTRSVFHKSRKGFISLKKTYALYQSIGLFLVDLGRIELPTLALRMRYAPSCATSPIGFVGLVFLCFFEFFCRNVADGAVLGRIFTLVLIAADRTYPSFHSNYSFQEYLCLLFFISVCSCRTIRSM